MNLSAVEPDSSRAAPADLSRYREQLHALHQEMDAEIARLAPVCALSGRCCRFLEYGHTLFLSSLEAELLMADAPPPSRTLDDGATCPWQDGLGRCSARSARPLGCRIYFCDPAYQPEAPRLSESAIRRLKRLTESLGLDWHYAPLHIHLRRFMAEGRFPEVGDTSLA
jgi:Fe-S-cluster containining protein